MGESVGMAEHEVAMTEPGKNGEAVLRFDNVSKRFGGVQALDRIRVSVSPARITAIAGPNGAGKSTLFHTATGLVVPDEGNVVLDGKDVTGFHPGKLVKRGLARTFQDPRIFGGLCILDNLSIPIQSDRTSCRNRRDVLKKKAKALLGLVGLSFTDEALGSKKAGTLSFGQQKLLSLAQALAVEPRILLLDEPFSGIHAVQADRMESLLRELSEKGISILLIEHSIQRIFNLAHFVYVLHNGRNLAEGTPEGVFSDPAVEDVFLKRRKTRNP